MNPKSSISFNCSNKTSETLKIELNTILKLKKKKKKKRIKVKIVTPPISNVINLQCSV